MVSRIGTFANTNMMVQASLKLQARLADQQAQEATGLKSTSFSGLKGDAGKVLDLQAQAARLEAESATASTAAADVQSAYSAVGSILDLATTVRTRLSAGLSATTTTATAITAEDAKGWLQTLQSALNTEVGGRYVFAGQAVDRAPVDFTAAAYDPAGNPGVADTGYYQGAGAERQMTTVGGGAIQISVGADAPGFETLARALSLLAAGQTDQATLSTAYDQVSSALKDLATTQATLSNQASALDTLSSENTVKTTTVKNLASDLKGADLSTAAVMVTQYQTQLEAIYSAIGKLASDSILKYL
jgi:flagellar hook-associated protein 3 FlgL